MKSTGHIFVILSFCFVLFSCGTTADHKADSNTSDIIENEITVIPEYFYNWQYKGFGAEIPEWINAALTMDKAALQEFFPDQNFTFSVFTGDSLLNVENQAKAYEQTAGEENIIERFWVSTIKDLNEYSPEDETFYSIRIISIEE